MLKCLLSYGNKSGTIFTTYYYQEIFTLAPTYYIKQSVRIEHAYTMCLNQYNFDLTVYYALIWVFFCVEVLAFDIFTKKK